MTLRGLASKLRYAVIVLLTAALLMLVRHRADWPTSLVWLVWPLTLGAGLVGIVGVVVCDSSGPWAVRTRIGLVVGLLGATFALTAARAAGHVLLPLDVWPGTRYPAVLAIGSVAAAIGLLRRTPWGRWLVVALGLGGGATSLLNIVTWVASGSRDGSVYFVSGLWTANLILLASVEMLVLVTGAEMRDAFDPLYSAERPETIWRAPSRLVVAVRWAVVGELVALAMCVLYGWGQPVVPSTATSALVIAATVLVGVGLTVARKTAGVLLLVLSGFALLAQSAATLAGARTLGMATLHTAVFYSVFWIAAGVLGVACGVVLFVTVTASPRARRGRRRRPEDRCT